MTILNCSATNSVLAVISRSPVTTHTVLMKQAVAVSATVQLQPCKTAVPNTAAAKRSTSTAKHRNAPTTTNVNVPPPPLM